MARRAFLHALHTLAQIGERKWGTFRLLRRPRAAEFLHVGARDGPQWGAQSSLHAASSMGVRRYEIVPAIELPSILLPP
jgi:hypothetical protein